MKETIYVYQRNEKGVLKQIEEYATPMDFAKVYWENAVRQQFTNGDAERTSTHFYHNPVYKFVGGHRYFFNSTVYAKVARNARDKIIPVSQLIGYSRTRKPGGRPWHFKKIAYGGFRPIRTFQERKWANAWDDEEFCPPVRAARGKRYLPDSWDDIYAHCEKSWKFQSKRKHQWRSGKND